MFYWKTLYETLYTKRIGARYADADYQGSPYGAVLYDLNDADAVWPWSVRVQPPQPFFGVATLYGFAY